MMTKASCSGTSSRSISRAISPCAAVIPFLRVYAYLFTKGSPERLRASAASCESMTSRKIRVTFSVIAVLWRVLGSYVAVALENARLYQEARESERRMRSELDTAREIQRQLLPTGAREVPGLDLAAGYVPARELGGDFYDC